MEILRLYLEEQLLIKYYMIRHLILLTSSTYTDLGVESNDKDPKSKVGDHVRLAQYKNIYAKGYTPNWSVEVFVIKKVKNTVPWTYAIEDLNGEKIDGTTCEKELQKNPKSNRVLNQKRKKKGDKLYVKKRLR